MTQIGLPGDPAIDCIPLDRVPSSLSPAATEGLSGCGWARAAEVASEQVGEARTLPERDQRCFPAEREGLLLIDLDSEQLLNCNPTILVLTGFERSQIINRRIGDLARLADGRSWRQVLESGQSATGGGLQRLQLRRNCGSWVTYSCRLQASDVDHGKMLECILSAGDNSPTTESCGPLPMDRLGQSLQGAVSALGALMHCRDPYTQGHQQRVAILSRALAEALGLEPWRVEAIGIAALLHDIGKIAVPIALLTKPTALKAEEYQLIKTHVQTSYEVLKPIPFPWPIATIVHQHHERLDGSGYPLGLSGHQILLEARILAVADTVESMASERPYRHGHGLEAALHLIETHRERLYAGDVVDACLDLFRVQNYSLPRMEEMLHR